MCEKIRNWNGIKCHVLRFLRLCYTFSHHRQHYCCCCYDSIVCFLSFLLFEFVHHMLFIGEFENQQLQSSIEFDLIWWNIVWMFIESAARIYICKSQIENLIKLSLFIGSRHTENASQWWKKNLVTQ